MEFAIWLCTSHLREQVARARVVPGPCRRAFPSMKAKNNPPLSGLPVPARARIARRYQESPARRREAHANFSSARA